MQPLFCEVTYHRHCKIWNILKNAGFVNLNSNCLCLKCDAADAGLNLDLFLGCYLIDHLKHKIPLLFSGCLSSRLVLCMYF